MAWDVSTRDTALPSHRRVRRADAKSCDVKGIVAGTREASGDDQRLTHNPTIASQYGEVHAAANYVQSVQHYSCSRSFAAASAKAALARSSTGRASSNGLS